LARIPFSQSTVPEVGRSDCIGPGDVVLVTRRDRLARSTRDLLNILYKTGKASA
jgi:hypothetical protein